MKILFSFLVLIFIGFISCQKSIEFCNYYTSPECQGGKICEFYPLQGKKQETIKKQSFKFRFYLTLFISKFD